MAMSECLLPEEKKKGGKFCQQFVKNLEIHFEWTASLNTIQLKIIQFRNSTFILFHRLAMF